MIQQLKNAIARNRKERDERRKAKAKQRGIAFRKKQGREKAQKEREELLKQLDRERSKLNPDKAVIERLRKEIAEAHDKAHARDHDHDYAAMRSAELRSKIAWNLKRITILRRKLKKARQEAQEGKPPSPQSWHGNGHEWHNLTWNAKVLLAISVVDYGNYCTSITRNWGTGSHHESIPTRGFDCGGANMTKFQQDLRYGRIKGYALSDILELYGPDNNACADNGYATTMPEGSSNETLHDNHTHAFVY